MLQSYSHEVVTSTRNISHTRAIFILLLANFKIIQTIYVSVRLGNGNDDMPENEVFILSIKTVFMLGNVMTPYFSFLQ